MAEKAAEILSSLKIPKLYGQVVITLENVLLQEDRLASTPSSLDGLDPETEMDLRILGCELIQTAGILLRLPQVAMATGQVLFHRFYHSKSFVRQPMEVTAMGCLCCASKVEEAPRRIRDVISVFEHIKQVRGGKPLTPVLLDQGYINLKNQVIKAERRVLKELGFCVHVKHPHKIVVMYLQILGFEKNKKLVQLSWNYMNDSLRTDVFVRYSPETIACACIYLSARKLSIVLPKRPAWYLLFGSVEKDLKDICIRILKLYTRTRPNADELDRIVAQLEQAYQESRQRSKGAGHIEEGIATPVKSENHSTFSPNATGLLTAPTENKAQSADSAGSTPSVMKGDEKNHVSAIASKTAKTADVPSRSVSRSASPINKHDKDRRHKSRHHRHHHHSRKTTKRSKSRSRSPRSRSIEKRTTSSRTDRGGGGGGDHRDTKNRERRKRDSASDKYDSRDRDRDTKDRDHKRRQDKNKERDRRRDRSLSRDRRR